MKTFFHFRSILLCLVAIVLLEACTKNDFMPEPVGEAVPTPEYATLLTALNAPEYSLFRAAWQKAGMDAILQNERPQGKFTYLVANNQAMQTAGLTESAINAASVNTLADWLRYNVLVDQVTLPQLAASGADLQLNTMLTHSRFLEGAQKEAAITATVPYRYRHFLSASGNNLIDNGKPVKVEKEITVASGQVMVIDKVLTAPDKQMMDVLKQDGRFSLFLKAIQISDELYAPSVVMNWDASFEAPYSFLTNWDYFLEGTVHFGLEKKSHVIRFTLLAPTNAAFNELGIYNEADLRALNNRVPDPGYYGTYDLTPLDSLLRLQKIGTGKLYTDYVCPDDCIPTGVIQKDQYGNNAVFFQHSLRGNLLSNYILRAPFGTNEYLPIDFGKDASGRVTMKHKDSNTAAVPIAEADINTIQGPIHAVDHIFMPNDFTMWHKK